METNTSEQKTSDEINITVKLPMDLASVLEHVQTVILQTAMKRFNGNRTHAANSLGLNRTTLIWKAKRHGLLPD
jgi:DNA-binding protein Fis